MPTSPHDDFDQSLRQLQQHAEGALSPATLSQLRQARLQATSAHTASSPWRRRGWWLATACSAVLAVTVAARFNNIAPPDLPSNTVAATGDDTSDDTLLFDESPELYLWLGSDGALAME
ncbi:hypothetical protein ABB26_07480 [Stenotrophomonas humi]|uniref:Uncharacterized protein n=1 Tax=Stenotrophomonas humi TaxID=405444 RepID=A0A0R0C3Y6_9GAMM|nr:hypothetical protein [Stenotrophomonas humi]KRG64457.1 hypothetical protein ABB26_07480 [Stenotrophomonas humi]